MPAEFMDFKNFVGTYEVLPATPGSLRDEYGYLRQKSPAKIVSVKRKALEFAIGLLLKTDVRNLDADGISKLERNVLLISRQIGMLQRKGDYPALKTIRAADMGKRAQV